MDVSRRDTKVVARGGYCAPLRNGRTVSTPHQRWQALVGDVSRSEGSQRASRQQPQFMPPATFAVAVGEHPRKRSLSGGCAQSGTGSGQIPARHCRAVRSEPPTPCGWRPAEVCPTKGPTGTVVGVSRRTAPREPCVGDHGERPLWTYGHCRRTSPEL